MIFTSESVCSGHPDKICDRISDAILDAVLSQDTFGRVAVETLVTENTVIVAGEVTAKKLVDYDNVARKVIKSLGYTHNRYRFTDKSPITVLIHSQSPEIAEGVDKEGAGDQGMMFGYACNETESLMPLPIRLAHTLAEQIDDVRESKTLEYLRPDGKTQVGIQYENGKVIGIDSLVLAVPHDEKISLHDVTEGLYKEVVLPILNEYGLTFSQKDLIVNGTGVWP